MKKSIVTITISILIIWLGQVDFSNNNNFITAYSNNNGSKVGNIVNGGWVAKQDSWYYLSFSDNEEENSKLYKINLDGTIKIKLSDDCFESL